MSNKRTVVVATSNHHKVSELSLLLKDISLTLQPQTDFFKESPEETGLSFVENALIKARYASKKTGLPAIADDSGLLVESLRGAPGIYSARYSGDNATDFDNNQKLLKALDATDNRKAKFVCTLVYLPSYDYPSPIIASGFWQGEIVTKVRGENGFGYDPIFYIPELLKTAAELTKQEKSTYSHRAIAAALLESQLKLIL